MSNNFRLYLWLALAALLWINYTTWTAQFAPHPGPATTASAPAEPSSLASRVPQSQTPESKSKPAGPPATPATPATHVATPVPVGAPSAQAPLIHVRTDVYDLEISTQGGTLVRVDLLKYAKIEGKSARVRLENTDSATEYLLQTGLTGPAGAAHPDQAALYSAPRLDYRLDGAKELRVPLTWSSGGVTVTKTFVFRPDSYRIGLEYTIHNHGASPWQASQYAQLFRNDPRTKHSYFNPNSESYHGPSIWNGHKYLELDPASSDYQHYEKVVTNGWIAVPQHDFVSAVVPPKGGAYRFTSHASGTDYAIAAVGPAHTVAPGGTLTLSQSLYVGPTLQAQLEKADPTLTYLAISGWYAILARPLFWLLSQVHRITGNWGVAIILVTLLLKLVFYPLSEASGRSMAKMKALGPRIKNIQETYKDDKEKLSRAMIEVYKREKVNPVSGCLPMILQLPVFIAFYFVLLYSAELRQAPFVLWIHDLSARDPYFILPGIMAVAGVLQYRLNPAPPDPVQAKVMMVMPVAMAALFAFFPSGLVLYYVVNSLLSIAQQWNINRRIAVAKRPT